MQNAWEFRCSEGESKDPQGKTFKKEIWHQKLSYRMTLGDEVEDMFFLLNEVKRQIPSVTGVSSGAIASDYQRLRVESVCSRLGLVSLAYLWKQDQSLLLQEMITNGIVAITVKVAAMGLDPSKHLGKEMASLQPYLHKLKELYGINVCGEGGEYETLTLDCPLFVNARIMLDEFQVILHSSDSIAPVGVLHPLAFHLENKAQSCSLGSSDKTHEMYHEKKGFVCEVQGDHPQGCDAACQDDALVNNLVELAEHKLHISRTQKGDTFSICSRLQDSCTTSPGLQEDLEAILKKIESLLVENGFGWENVLYIHLYIADMNEFATANDTYVRYITQEKCPFGVPSRSTIELPLLQVGLGSAYMEVFVANDHTKRVLHVQSISCWAPSCIGPYSQATLHKEILHMAGQLGLNPPTMTLCQGGAIDELEKALENSEAVAKCFNCSVSTSAIAFVIYCSTKIPSTERFKIQDKQDAFLKQTRVFNLDKGTNSEAFDPIFLYVLVPDLPKGALVEVKPILFVADDIEEPTGDVKEQSCSSTPGYWGFQHAEWHDSCFQKCVVPGKLCTVILSVNSEPAATICHDHLVGNKNKGDNQNSLTEWQMDRVLRFCIYLLDKIITESGFSWDDTMYLRFYFPISLQVPANALSLMFTNAFDELAAMGRIIKTGKEPIFNLVPVLGAGRSSASMDDIITCELLARKS
ncbi:diphthine--ammonia ligase isoform X2 [Prunus dulcis]|uniref:diphthine--ammonia ligase isoform X2 n=1 Tax=Prunus dulcis TaxID=3755 RepID=UPI00148393C5|nr:diphthine--ammonia ligase isoform X2 [Prunus dulcis]